MEAKKHTQEELNMMNVIFEVKEDIQKAKTIMQIFIQNFGFDDAELSSSTLLDIQMHFGDIGNSLHVIEDYLFNAKEKIDTVLY